MYEPTGTETVVDEPEYDPAFQQAVLRTFGSPARWVVWLRRETHPADPRAIKPVPCDCREIHRMSAGTEQMILDRINEARVLKAQRPAWGFSTCACFIITWLE